MQIVVVGAGAIGLCAAYFLRAAGAEVTVIESNRCGSGASSGNAGWIVPSLSAPMPGPGVAKQTLKWLGRADSPVYIKPRFAPRFLAWLWRFWRACNSESHTQGIAALAGLNNRTMELFDRLAADGIQFEMYRRGLVFAFLDRAAAETELEHMGVLRDFGYDVPDEILDGENLRELEPALSRDVTGGFFLDGERHVDPQSLVGALAAALRDMGVVIHEGVHVTDFVSQEDRVTHVRTSDGVFRVRHLLLAAGAWTSDLLRVLGRHLPMEGGKGYSVTIRPRGSLHHPLYLGDVKVGCSPLDGHVRLAGTMELSGLNLELDQRRVDAILRGADSYLAEWAGAAYSDAWVGLRPLTPDGLPVIDRVHGFRNLYVSTGHSTLGITLAPSSGSAITEFMLSGDRPAVLKPFSFDRF